MQCPGKMTDEPRLERTIFRLLTLVAHGSVIQRPALDLSPRKSDVPRQSPRLMCGA